MYMVIFLCAISVIALLFTLIVMVGKCLVSRVESTGTAILLSIIFATAVLVVPMVYKDKVSIPNKEEISSFIDIESLSK